MTSHYRYGLFLRPSPELSRLQAELHELLRRQFGLVAAGSFPPHVTILGHVATRDDHDEVIAAAARALEGVEAVAVHNHGLTSYHGGIAHDVGRLANGENNPALFNLFLRAKRGLDPLRVPLGSEFKGGVQAESDFYGHMTIAGHDLSRRPELFDEVFNYLDSLGVAAVGDSVWDFASLYAFETRSGWNGPWWETMTWRLLASFPLVHRASLLDERVTGPCDHRVTASIGR